MLRSVRLFHAVDSHTEGMPTRVVTSGFGRIHGNTMAERARNLAGGHDDLRTLLMYEPRGHASMSGSVLQPPCDADADVGVIFIEVSGLLPMCGHGAIGTATVLIETGMVEAVEPRTQITLDTPAGLVGADVEVSNGKAVSVTLTNVASFFHRSDLVVPTESFGDVTMDIAFGGNFYPILDAASVGLELVPRNQAQIVEAGLEIIAAVNESQELIHPDRPDISGVRHVLFTGPPQTGEDALGAVAIQPGWIDRSPCGTGTSARMAQLHGRGRLDLGVEFVHSSLIGSVFRGRLTGTTVLSDGTPAVIPQITGRAWITGLNQYVLDPTDPYPAGFLMQA